MIIPQTFSIAAVQASPVFLDRDATIQKACDLIAEAADLGASLAVFPEAFVPAYPVWVWYIPSGKTHDLRSLYAELLENAIDIPGPATDLLCAAAKKAGIAVAIGVNERNTEGSRSTLYNSILYIGPNGDVPGRHRKLVPTTGERLVWGQGDGSDLGVHSLPFGRVGGLICWENYMPLARYTLYARGVELYVAPTWDRGEPWISTMRHIAKEGRCYVVGCCSAMRLDDLPDRLAFKTTYLSDSAQWLNPGLSVIVDPDGKIVAGPLEKEEGILIAEVDRSTITGSRFQLDTAGHYARPDVFDLRVATGAKPFLREVDSIDEGERDAHGMDGSLPT
ncbi:MAG: carbon-nitrogen hydrolase family protein [Rhodothermales bacterium]